ncbi:MAG: lysophospholipid acyltransferase family protein [Gemmatimonadaceae bacterium]
MSSDRQRRKERKVRWAARLGPAVIAMLARTWRIATVNTQSFETRREATRPVIFAFWHANMLPLLWQHRGQGAAVLISTHSDGEIIARICEALGYRTIRGSTSRGGARALVELVRALDSGIDVAITPVGPRGPAHSIAPGVVYTAQRADVPIIPTQVHASRAWRLKTWDRFMIPKPFARITIRYGDPLIVPTSAQGVTLEHESERLGAALHELASA